MDKLILADLQALAASPDYGGRGFLQSSSAVLGLSAALFLSDLSLWQGAGYKLTDDEIDDIQAMIAQLEEDLMVTGDMYPIDKCKVTRNVVQPIPDNVLTRVQWNAEIYDPQNMHDNVVANTNVYVVRDGLHLISVQIGWIAAAVGLRTIILRKYPAAGGFQYLARDYIQNPLGTSVIYQFLNIHDEAVEGDYYVVDVKQTSGIPINTTQDDFSPFLSVVRL